MMTSQVLEIVFVSYLGTQGYIDTLLKFSGQPAFAMKIILSQLDPINKIFRDDCSSRKNRYSIFGNLLRFLQTSGLIESNKLAAQASMLKNIGQHRNFRYHVFTVCENWRKDFQPSDFLQLDKIKGDCCSVSIAGHTELNVLWLPPAWLSLIHINLTEF